MNKIEYLRQHFMDLYEEDELDEAVEAGAKLMREYWQTQTGPTLAHADDLFNLAILHHEMENLDAAIDLYSESARQIKFLKGECVELADRLVNLASALHQKGMAPHAYAVCREMVEIYRRTVDAKSLALADGLYTFANIASEVVGVDVGLYFHLEAMNIRRESDDTPIDDIIDSLQSVAFLYEAKSDYENAIPFASAAKMIAENGPRFLGACNYLADLYEANKEYDKAADMYADAQEVARATIGAKHATYIKITLKLATSLFRANRHNASLYAHHMALNALEKTCGVNHIFYTNCLKSMAMVHESLGDTSRVETLLMRAIKLRKAIRSDI